MFLVRLGGKDNGRSPGTEAFADPAVGLQDLEVRHDDLALVRPVVRFLTADRRGSTGVNSEFKIQDWVLDTSRVETVPMGFDDGGDGSTRSRVDIGADHKILGELGEVTVTVPKVDVGANIDKRRRRVANSATILLEFEDSVVNVIAVVQWNVTVDWLGSPYLGRDFDDKSGCGWVEGRD
jgi:hypothetical protein